MPSTNNVDMYQQYLFGKKVVKKSVSTLKGGKGHQIPVKEAADADFITPTSTFKVAPVNYSKRHSSFGTAVQPIRETAIAIEAARRAKESVHADPFASSEAVAPVFSSFGKPKGAVGWGKPRQQPFRDFVGDAELKHKEPTEFTSNLRSSIQLQRTSSRMAASSAPSCRSVQRGDTSSSSAAGDRHRSAAVSSDRSRWLQRAAEATPGPGSYFVP